MNRDLDNLQRGDIILIDFRSRPDSLVYEEYPPLRGYYLTVDDARVVRSPPFYHCSYDPAYNNLMPCPIDKVTLDWLYFSPSIDFSQAFSPEEFRMRLPQYPGLPDI